MDYILSNPYNQFSNQRIPTFIYEIEFVDFKSKRYPDGMAMVKYRDYRHGIRDTTRPLKVYKNKNGTRYVHFGNLRLDLETKNQPINIVASFKTEHIK